ncbi:hypothetical protein RN001_006512 [Aquatica leii]|uniref:Uncharacterized protein n=1 Tax=Aquatica leii TaxID=1421715 RepID=A0AAN7PE62_9COLE|nr:hypothetical protein RN001_006512 [Aquatica leii]
MLWLLFYAYFLFTKFEYNEANCSIKSVNSDDFIQEEFYDEYLETFRCCQFEVLYAYVECNYVFTETSQDLKIMLATSNSIYNKKHKYPTPAKYIKFSNSYVPIIYAGSFFDFPQITELYINASSVKEIQPGAFNNLQYLEVIRVDQNNISEITRGVFNHLTKLRELDLSHNYIKTIEKNSFLGLTELQTLKLNYNQLKLVSSDYFSSLNYISNKTQSSDYSSTVKTNLTIDLSFNFLENLNFSTLPFTTSKLSLNNNQIEKMTGVMMPGLTDISLNSNRIVHLSSINKWLIQLNLSSNAIEELALGLFDSNNLTRLDLSNNLIEKLHKDIFDNLTDLVLLNLQNNNIDYIPVGLFQALSSLKYLNMSGNKLSEIEYGTFAGLQNVWSLDISNNSLTYIVETTFHPLNQLTELFINHNLITTIDSSYFCQLLQTLRKIHLGNNPWICKHLLNAITRFSQHNIIVEQGMHKKTTNVNGIACYNYNKLKKQLENTTPTNNSSLSISNYNWDQFNNFFNEGFFNTSFYNFFKDNTNLEFENKLTNIFQKQVDTLNYTLFKLINNFRELEENRNPKHANLISTLPPHFAKLSDDFEERFINKISNTLTNNSLLLMIIVIILICLFAVVLLKNYFTTLSCLVKRNAIDDVKNESNANLELI